MANFNEIVDKIKDILCAELGERKIYDKDVASSLGINQISLATMKNRNKIPYKEILEFCAKRKISINWLLFDQIIESLYNETKKFSRISYFRDIYASAGGGALNYEDASTQITLDEEFVAHLGGAGVMKNVEAINVIGDSMEPTLTDGDIVFFDRSSTNPCRTGIYILTTPAGLFIKRLQLQANGKVALVSDNKNYSDEIINANDVRILGKVLGTLSCEV
ncbi:MAG: LexA family transcriptional regulator [Sulfurospirillum sp.]|nr:LexA family transcriptional regulator [Sulfurospirillum sp.]